MINVQRDNLQEWEHRPCVQGLHFHIAATSDCVSAVDVWSPLHGSMPMRQCGGATLVMLSPISMPAMLVWHAAESLGEQYGVMAKTITWPILTKAGPSLVNISLNLSA